MSSHMAASSSDVEDGFSNYKGPMNDRLPAYIRAGFVRKVYSILCAQLLLTFCIALPFKLYLTPSWAVSHSFILTIAQCGTMAFMLCMVCCCRQQIRTFPMNYMFLGGITVGISVMVGFVTIMYKTDSVLLALAATTAVFGGLTAYAFFTKSDFTGIGPYLAAALMALIGFSFVMTLFSFFFTIPPIMHILYALVGTVLFSLYIVYDTQLIIGGKSVELGVDEYVFAALNLYLDIINLFLSILKLVGSRDN